MDEEERQKKLQAGKERLAAFQRKKGRKKKKKTTDGDTASESSFGDISVESSLSYEESHDGSADEMSNLDRDDTERTNQLQQTIDRITELEEALHGKQTALDNLIQENDQLKSKHVENASPVEEYIKKIEEFQVACSQRDQAIVQRDEMIKQLSARLESEAAGQDVESSQTQQLAQQVHVLQQQLEQAGIMLRKQSAEHNMSAQTLEQARDEILALKRTIQSNETTLTKLAHKNSELAEQVHEMKNESKTSQEREKDSAEVVRKLMSDVEALQKSGVKNYRSGQHVGGGEADEQLAALRAELDEAHGQQIVMMKQQMMQVQKQALEQLQLENQALTKQVKDWENWYRQAQEQLSRLNELREHLESLSAQNRAFQAEIEALNKIKVLYEQIDVNKMDEMNSENERLCLKLNDSESVCSRLRIKVNELQAEMSNITSQYSDNEQEKIEEMSAEQSRLKSQLNKSQTMNERLGRTIEELKLQLKEHTSNSTAEKERLSTELQESLAVNSHLKNRVNELNSRVEILSSNDSNTGDDVQRIDDLLEERDRLNAQLAHSHLVNSQLSRSVEEFKSQIRELSGQLEDVDASHNKDLTSENKTLASEVDLLTSQNVELCKTIEDLESEKDALKSEVWQCNAEIGGLNNKIDSINLQFSSSNPPTPGSLSLDGSEHLLPPSTAFFGSSASSPVESRKPGFPALDEHELINQNNVLNAQLKEKIEENIKLQHDIQELEAKIDVGENIAPTEDDAMLDEDRPRSSSEENDLLILKQNLAEAERKLQELTNENQGDDMAEMQQKHEWEIANLKEHYEETMAFELRTQKCNLQEEHETVMRKYQEKMRLEMSSKLEGAKLVNEQKFVEEMRRVKKDISMKSKQKMGELQAQNEELSLARDVLLQQRTNLDEDGELDQFEEPFSDEVTLNIENEEFYGSLWLNKSGPTSNPNDPNNGIEEILHAGATKDEDIVSDNLTVKSYEDIEKENQNLKNQVQSLLSETVDEITHDLVLKENQILKEELTKYKDTNLPVEGSQDPLLTGHWTLPSADDVDAQVSLEGYLNSGSDFASSDELIQEIMSLRAQLESQSNKPETNRKGSLQNDPDLTEEVGKLREDLQIIKEDNARLEDEKSLVDFKLESSQQTFMELQEKYNSLKNDLEDMKLRISETNIEEAAISEELKNRLSEEKDEKSVVGNQLEVSQNLCSDLEQKLKSVQEDLLESQSKNKFLSRVKDAATAEVLQLKQQIYLLMEEKKDTNKELKYLKQKLSTLSQGEKEVDVKSVFHLCLPPGKELSPPKCILSPVIEEPVTPTDVDEDAELDKQEELELDVSQVSSVSSLSTLPSPGLLEIADLKTEEDAVTLRQEVARLSSALQEQKDEFQHMLRERDDQMDSEKSLKQKMSMELETLKAKCEELEKDKMKAIKDLVDTRTELELTQEQYKLEVSQLEVELQNIESHSTPIREENKSAESQNDNSMSASFRDEVRLHSSSCNTSPIVFGEKLEYLEKSNAELIHENRLLNSRLSEQERVVNNLRERMNTSEFVSHDTQSVFHGQQLAMLRTQRDQLVHRLEVQMDKEKTMSDILGQHNLLEENLRREKHLLSTKLREKEAIEIDLLRERSSLETKIREQQDLENSLLQKDQIEVELTKQKRILENELDEIETRLMEREWQLEHEKEMLSNELKSKDLVIQELETSYRQKTKQKRVDFSVTTKFESDIARVKTESDKKSLTKVKSIRYEVEQEHADAIERLRHDLSMEFDSRDSGRRHQTSWLSL